MKPKNSPISPTEEVFDNFMAENQTTHLMSIDSDPGEERINSLDEGKQSRFGGSDKDSDYGISDYETGEATTFRMLFEKIQGNECDLVTGLQELGLISKSVPCSSCDSQEPCFPSSVPPPYWLCPSCPSLRPVDLPWLSRPPSTPRPPLPPSGEVDLGSGGGDSPSSSVVPPPLRLRDAVLLTYAWARGYPLCWALHECEVGEEESASFVYGKAKKATVDYFNNEMSNIGGPKEVIEVEIFQVGDIRSDDDPQMTIVGGVESLNPKIGFFNLLTSNWTRDDVISVLIDNTVPGSILRCSSKGKWNLIDIIGKDGMEYLSSSWGINLEEKGGDSSVGGPSSLWKEFTNTQKKESLQQDSCSIENPLSNDKDSTNPLNEGRLFEFLFRKRMSHSRDPFLYFLNVLAVLYPPSNGKPSSECDESTQQS